MSKKFDILVIGELNVDLILDSLEGVPAFETEQIAREMTLTMGSSSAIFAANTSSLGSSVIFSGMLGDDQFGRLILDTLEKKNVITDFITIDKKTKTGLTVAFSSGNERMMVTYPGAMEKFSFDDVSGHLFEKVRHLHISNIFLQREIKQDIYAIFEEAKRHNLTTSLDTQWDPDETWDLDLARLLPHLDFFLPNEKELMYLTNMKSVEKALNQLPETSCTVVVKRGKKGAILKTPDEQFSVDAFLNKQVADAIGAGDSFNAGFINAFLRGKTLRQCVVAGNLTGALSTTKQGGTAAIISYNQLETYAKQHGITL
mgnify:CR=1 FL=1